MNTVGITLKGTEPTWIALGRLIVDPRVQRQALNMAHVYKIADKFDPEAFKLVAVNYRPTDPIYGDGSYAIMDGAHRCEALREIGFGPDQLVPCDLHKGLTLAEEAAMFEELNHVKVVGAADKFRVSVTAGDPLATEVDKIVTSLGWKIGRAHSKDPMIGCVTALRTVYAGPNGNEPMPGVLYDTIKTITDAWGHDPRAMRGSLVAGIGNVIRRDAANKNLDLKGLAQRLAAYKGGHDGIIGTARAVASGSRKINDAVSFVVVDIHNRARQTRKLDRWTV